MPVQPNVPDPAGPALCNPSKLSPSDILTSIGIFDLHKYAMEDHFRVQAEYGTLAQGKFSENMYDIPDDRTSIRMGMLGDAARIGKQSQQHVLPFVKNVEGYIERTALDAVNEIERGKEELKLEEAVGKEADRLIDDLTRGKI
jgi:hypothetical protein